MTSDLTAQQGRIVDAAGLGRNILTTGSAGTGKSHLLRAMQMMPGSYLHVCASTGISAVNVGGRTIHSWAGIGRAEESAEYLASNCGEKAAERIRSAGRLAIDEISMISAELFQKLDKVMRIVRQRDQPFGGVQLLMFGDFLQLPPVVRGVPPEGSAYFAFESQAWRDATITLGMLTQVFRQEDVAFAKVLNECRVGRISRDGADMLISRLGAEDPDPTKPAIIVHTRNVDVDRENAANLAAIKSEEQKFEAQDGGTQAAALKLIQDHCLAPATLRLRVGARVMLLTNLEIGAGLANGTLGTVTKLSVHGPEVRFDNGLERYLEAHTWDIKEQGYILAWRKQIPLRLAWSITTHKSQGLAFDKIRVHLSNVFEFGQAYVAISRARSLAGLFIADSKKGAIRAHPAAVAFYDTAPSVESVPSFTLEP